MEKIAIIDLGSNSARLVLVNIMQGGYFAVFDELKETVRLAQDMETDGFLKPVRIAKTIKTLKMFRRLCDANKITRIYAYATAAVRRAKNQRSFLDEIASTCGFKLHVLEPDEEAHLVYQGVINSMDIPKGLIMDIGGGSTQFIYYNRRTLLGHTTIPFGAVTLTDMFKDGDYSPSERCEKIQEFFTEKLKEIPFLQEIDPETRLIGVGGSFRNVGKISRLVRKYPLDMTHNYVIEKNEFLSIFNNVKKLDLDSTMKIKGLSSLRADIFPAALAAINAVGEFLNLDYLTVSGSGLREGVMFKYAVPSTNEKPITDVLGHSVYTLLKYYDENIEHAEQVYNLSVQLYKQLKVLHKLPRFYVRVLRTAAMLHDSGNRIKYYDHHKHSAYIILNSNLYGISHRELVIASFIASLHRKGQTSSAELLKYRDLLSEEDVDAISKLGVIVRIAESFDRSMSGLVTNITCDVLGDSVIMKTESASEADYSLEIKDALTASEEFRKAYKKNLQIL